VKRLSILQFAVLLFVGCLSAANIAVTSKCSAVKHSLQPMWLAYYDANESDILVKHQGHLGAGLAGLPILIK